MKKGIVRAVSKVSNRIFMGICVVFSLNLVKKSVSVQKAAANLILFMLLVKDENLLFEKPCFKTYPNPFFLARYLT